MSLYREVLLRLSGLTLLLVSMVVVGASIFVSRAYRSDVADWEAARARVIADHLERLILRDDRVGMTRILRFSVSEQRFRSYAFVAVAGRPLAWTFPAGVPRALLANGGNGGAGGPDPLVFRDRQGQVYLDLMVPVADTGAELHIGLDRAAIDRSARPLLARIGLMGIAALILGLVLAELAGRRASREVKILVQAMRSAIDTPNTESLRPTLSVSEIEELITMFNLQMENRHKAERALDESRGRFERHYTMVRLMADNLPDMLWAKDLDGRYLFANRALCECLLMASDTEEPIGKTDLFFARRERAARPDDPAWHTFGELCVDSDGIVLERKAPGQFDESGNVRGRFLCLDVHKAPFFDKDGRIIGTVGTARDVTRERALEAERRLLQTAVDQADMGVIILDFKGTVIYINKSYGRITGFAPEEILGRKVDLIFEQYRDPDVAEEIRRTVFSGRRWAGRVEKSRKDGTPYVQGQTIVPLRDEDGEVRTVVSYLQDITSQVELQKRYLQAQKLETVGRLAGGIAHDFNNLLGVIRAYADLIQMELKLHGEPHEGIAEILAATEAGARLTRQLLAFARRQPVAPRPLDLNAIVTDLQGMLRQLIGEDITLITELAEVVPPVLADPSQIEQVLVNLVVNARDAMPDGGRLEIVTRVMESPATTAGAETRPESWVVLEVRDTGVGMSEEVQEHIFEPFFTTKETSKGTGLGLATCFGIVTEAGGYIEVESRPDGGTTMRILLPPTPKEAPLDTGEKVSRSLPRGTETILLAEDEAQLRGVVTKMLCSLGYTVIEAADGAGALRRWKERNGEIDLLLTDEVMPGMAGSELVRQLRSADPGFPVILVSGHGGEKADPDRHVENRCVTISKPFSLSVIAKAIRRLLDDDGGQAPEEP